MPNFKISQLEKVTNMDPDSFVLVVQNGKNYRMSIKEAIAAYVDLSPYYTKEEAEEALNSVDTRIDTLEELATFRTIPVSYLDLRRLRDNGDLVPCQQYRITDYTCTTTQANTKSAGHVFDIIVTADDETTLNEVARAVKHDGDTYFANCDLNAWKIYYSLDNDTTRFAWADETNGKGVIYRMIDEWNNDVPYDFKNIQFKHPNDTTTYPYYYYTFASGNVEANTDHSLSISNNCYSNNIRGHMSGGKMILNNIIFIGGNCYKNSFGSDCYFNAFGSGCNSNSFGNNCYNNTFLAYCTGNTFGTGCHNNRFLVNCSGNTFEANCGGNTFGNECSSNSFGNYCNNNTFGNYCYNNTLGNNCYSNTFKDSCNGNAFGNNCNNNTFETNCGGNTFGNNCQYNIIGAYCNNNILGDACTFIKFADTIKYNYYRYNRVGDGCQYILFTGTETASSSSQVQNYNFAQGLQGTSSVYLTIDGVRNRSFETKVAKKSNGELKIYCEADLIL